MRKGVSRNPVESVLKDCTNFGRSFLPGCFITPVKQEHDIEIVIYTTIVILYSPNCFGWK